MRRKNADVILVAGLVACCAVLCWSQVRSALAAVEPEPLITVDGVWLGESQDELVRHAGSFWSKKHPQAPATIMECGMAWADLHNGRVDAVEGIRLVVDGEMVFPGDDSLQRLQWRHLFKGYLPDLEAARPGVKDGPYEEWATPNDTRISVLLRKDAQCYLVLMHRPNWPAKE